MTHRSAVRVIDDPEVLRLVTDPLRLRLLELLRQRPRTVKELAAALDIPRTRLYYHVNLLEEHDLIEVDDTRVVSGITESRYRATAFRLSVAKTLIGSSTDGESPVDAFLSIVLDEVIGEVRRAVAAGLIDLDLTHEDDIKPRRLVMGRAWYRFTDEDVAAFRRQYHDLKRAFASKEALNPPAPGDDVDDGTLYEYLVGFYPVVEPESDGPNA